ncbi:MAG: tetratricopeptide repeat protein, partial [Gammaproteobacteria bacterium]|nr:tetratricopeptide repeat protein [Gammaproteobacteria bacterium]
LLQLNPQHVNAQYYLALTQIAGENLASGSEVLENLQHNHPDRVDIFKSFVESLIRLNAQDKIRALAETENDSKKLFLLANTLMENNWPLPAIPVYEKLLARTPDNSAYLNNLASAYDSNNDFEKAIDLYKKSIALDPNYAGAYANLGRVLCDTNQLEQAETWLRKGLTVDPNDAGLYINLGRVFNFRQDFQQSRKHYQIALKLAPNNAIAMYNLGSSYQKTGELALAEKYYQQCLSIAPNHSDAELNLGLCQLSMGKFNSAWGHYFKRVRQLIHNEQLSPVIPGQDFQGKTVYLCFSQGIGDELFFLRFIPALKQQNAKVIYRCSRKLFPLLKDHPWLDQVIDENDAMPAADYYFTVDDLPLITAMDAIEKIPTAFPLQLENNNALDESLQALPRPFIGITWRAGLQIEKTNFRNNQTRLSKVFSLDDMIELFQDFTGTIFVLQRNPQESELALLDSKFSNVVNASEYNNDLQKMLSLLARLDDYVCVSNANIHLLSGINKSAKVLIPYPPEWRWMDTTGNSPWFPMMETYRQSSDGSWTQALNTLKSSLGSLYNAA